MKKQIEEKQSVYRKRQRHGMQDLRYMMMLYTIALLLYTALGYFLISNLQGAIEDLLRNYIIVSVISFIIWIIPIRMLWDFNRLGRILFFLCTILNIYIGKDILVFYAYDVTPIIYQYLYILLLVIKYILSIICCFHLAFSYTIRSIWSMDDMFDDELRALDEESTKQDEQEIVKPSKWILKAQAHMRTSSIRLAICLYSSLVLIFLGLSLVRALMPSESESIGAIQLPLFSQCLFSAMIWSLPVITLYIGKRWSPYMIYVAVIAEILSFCIRFSDVKNLLMLRIQDNSIRVLYIVIEVLRYIILFIACRSLIRSRLIKEYQHHEFSEIEDDEDASI